MCRGLVYLQLARLATMDDWETSFNGNFSTSTKRQDLYLEKLALAQLLAHRMAQERGSIGGSKIPKDCDSSEGELTSSNMGCFSIRLHLL